MAITLDADVGSPTANSYATVEEADARAELRAVSPLAAAWLVSSDDERKKSALISATMDIDAVLSSGLYFVGESATGAQALLFPLADSPGELPENLVAATIELAFTLLPTATSEPLDPVVSDKKSIKADDVTIEYFAPAARVATSVERWPGIVQRLLAPFLQILVTEGVWGTGLSVRTS